jgi:hypothetical protein
MANEQSRREPKRLTAKQKELLKDPKFVLALRATKDAKRRRQTKAQNTG